jgi:DUF4097 and DUF4098 domain-containing protein YvlB
MNLSRSFVLTAAVALTSIALPAQATRLVDSTIAVDSGGRVKIDGRDGRLTVRSWDGARLRVKAQLPAGDVLNMNRTGSFVQVGRVRGQMQGPAVDVEVWVPKNVVVEIHQREGVVDVAAVDGALEIHGALAAVKVSGGRAPVTVNTSAGAIDVTDSRASLSLTSSAGNISVRSTSGDVMAQTNAGRVTLANLASARVFATTMRGDVELRGTHARAADVTLDSHSGAVTITLVEGADATVRARSISGTILGRGARFAQREGLHELVVGGGSATIRATTFSGPIRVTAPNAR